VGVDVGECLAMKLQWGVLKSFEFDEEAEAVPRELRGLDREAEEASHCRVL
jgi:hypothetical protein